MSTPERRRFKRLNAPVLCRPLGGALVDEEGMRKVQDISLGGVCVYTDDPHKIGEHLELELFLPNGETVTLDTQICWIDKLPKGGPARFEVGLQYVDVAASDLKRIESLLKEL
jgi:Tfp pilus assembly protein PilZ